MPLYNLYQRDDFCRIPWLCNAVRTRDLPKALEILSEHYEGGLEIDGEWLFVEEQPSTLSWVRIMPFNVVQTIAGVHNYREVADADS